MRLLRVREGVWTILAVCDSRGLCPLQDFLGGFDAGAGVEERKMLALLDRTSKHGTPSNKEKFSPLRNDIWEFKTTKYRALCFFDANRVIVCTNGFEKNQRKTPPGEIERAMRERQRYIEAKSLGAIEIVDG